jgi:hypothetical protein
MERQMNFFGVQISDAQFEAAMEAARGWIDGESGELDGDAAVRKALGFETGDVAAPPAWFESWRAKRATEINRES